MTSFRSLFFHCAVTLVVAELLVASGLAAQVTSGQRYNRLAIRNATIVDGNGTPARGPADIVIQGNTIAEVVWLDPVAVKAQRARRPQADIEIDATGKYVLPGLINAHGHVQDERGGRAQPVDYQLKLWLASGITTVREVGADSTHNVLALRDRGRAGGVAAPRIYVYARFHHPPRPTNPAAARERVRALKRAGVDGIKITGLDRDILAAMLDEAKKQELRVAHHAGVEETNAWDDIRFGATSIEH